jgi:hypothetical protein
VNRICYDTIRYTILGVRLLTTLALLSLLSGPLQAKEGSFSSFTFKEGDKGVIAEAYVINKRKWAAEEVLLAYEVLVKVQGEDGNRYYNVTCKPSDLASVIDSNATEHINSQKLLEPNWSPEIWDENIIAYDLWWYMCKNIKHKYSR